MLVDYNVVVVVVVVDVAVRTGGRNSRIELLNGMHLIDAMSPTCTPHFLKYVPSMTKS